MVFKFASSSEAGYADVHFSSTISSFPTLLQISTASCISSIVAIPVEIIIDFLFEAVYLMS